MDVKLRGRFTVLSPLSHIGESISTSSYLAQEPVIQPDGSVEEVFVYSGNAWRGQLRDLAAEYLLEQLGGPRIPLQAFHLLFSGGAIGGEQSTNIDQARRMRRVFPLIALFGGGIGNQILPGKTRFRQCYPLCREAIPALPPDMREEAARVSYRALTFTKQYSRKDDSKDDRLAGHLPELPAASGQAALLDVDAAPKKREKDGATQQMRYEMELLAAGTVLSTGIDLLDVNEVELGCLVSALHRFSRSPHIGGKGGSGHGLVSLEYSYAIDGGEPAPFLAVEDGTPRLERPAEEAKRAYDEFVLDLYQQYIAGERSEMVALLGAGR